MNTLIKNAAVVFCDGVRVSDILIKNGKIADIDYKGEITENTEIIDADGDYLLAGFVDLHVHGGGGADFMDATVDAFETAVKAHLKHGTTLLYPTAVAASFEDLCDFLNAYNDFKANSDYADLTDGVHLEGPYFFGATQLSRGAQKADVLRLPDMAEVEKLLAVSKGSIARWDASPELPGAYEFANKMRECGIVCAVAHTDATAPETLKGFENGFNHVTHFYNATSLHRKREQTVYAGVVEATYLDDNVTVELIGDGCHIPKETFMLTLKIKGKDKLSVITDGMRIAGTDMQSGKLGSLKNGSEVIVDSGVAKLADKVSFAGSIATMDRCLRVLCNDFGIDLPTASVMLSLTPAKRMGADNKKGSIAVGKDADLVLVDKNLNVKQVMAGGKIGGES